MFQNCLLFSKHLRLKLTTAVNHFAQKMSSFSYYGRYCRLMIAALHFNENATRPQATNQDGTPQYAIKFPKFMHGDYSVRRRAVKPTYGYTALLMEENLRSITESVPCLTSVEPPPLCSEFIHPEKDEALSLFQLVALCQKGNGSLKLKR